MMIKSNRGQIAIEAVLMALVLVAMALAASNFFKSKKILAKMVDGPWSYLDGMVQHGVWLPASQALQKDPNLSPRRGSKRAEAE